MTYQVSKFKKRTRNENPEVSRIKILNDPFLRASYVSILETMKQLINQFGAISNRQILEIGSAGGITSEIDNQIITSDVRTGYGVRLIIDGNKSLPFKNNELRAIIAKDVLHHLSNPDDFFKEVSRVLEPGGIAVFAEPNWNLLSRLIFYFIHPEPYMSRQKSWTFESHEPMFSNQAIPWIIFCRDKALFAEKFPSLHQEVLEVPLNGLSFLASGGVYKRTRIPSSLLIKSMAIESSSNRWMKHTGLTRIMFVKKNHA
jgi:SAM-dependent methyltransferase